MEFDFVRFVRVHVVILLDDTPCNLVEGTNILKECAISFFRAENRCNDIGMIELLSAGHRALCFH
jgi:hypothetical protein